MDKVAQNQPKHRVHIEHTPNGGKIYRCDEFTGMDRAALTYYCATDPVCREWDLVDNLCDQRLLPFPELPASDPYNRPGYPDSDTNLWTPHEAITRSNPPPRSHLPPRRGYGARSRCYGGSLMPHP